MTTVDGLSIMSAAAQANIRYTTARDIIKWWKQSGRLYRSEQDEMFVTRGK